jgi:hypothetical protein
MDGRIEALGRWVTTSPFAWHCRQDGRRRLIISPLLDRGQSAAPLIRAVRSYPCARKARYRVQSVFRHLPWRSEPRTWQFAMFCSP